MTYLNCLHCEKVIKFEPLLAGICDECATPEEKAARDRKRVENRTSRIANSGLPLPLQGNPWPEGPAADAAKRWAAEEVPGLVLTGPVGVGKTYLAGCACWSMLQRRSVSWVPVAALMMRLRASFSDEERARAIHIVQGDGPLVLDDLDKANPTEFGKEVMFAAIDQRVSSGTPLLVTTNLDMDSIADRMGDPIASRLNGLRPLEMVGTDRRMAA